MSNTHNPNQHDDATHQNAPPPEQSNNEPAPSESPVVAELPASAPRTQSPTNIDGERDASPPRPRTKSEASTYPGSYRPSDAQISARIPSDTHYGLDHVEETEAAIQDAPPAYTELPGQISSEGADAIVADDGRVNIRIDRQSRALSQIILPQIQRQLTQAVHDPEPPPPYIPEFLGGAPGQEPPPPLNLVIQVVGSRGDVQPFVALGKVLKDTYGHRVRLATHPTFKDFVIENGLEFFSIGGDPAELMAFMVKNPGLMPGFDTLRSGDIGKRRKGIAEILRGTWRSCIETGNGLGVDPLKQTVEEWMGIEDQLPEQLRKPFVADAIIANPPSFGHIHCAEKLGIPLHMMFTMPWSPTQQFPHPLANIQSSSADATIANYLSYIMVDMLTWQGLGDIINKFRKESLSLDSISTISAPAMLARLKVPSTYCWSPALIPKPEDWGHHISVAGFYFLNLASNYTPAPELAEFLEAGEPPVYIGFGSIVVDDPNAMTKMIFEAVSLTGKRALVSKGWGGLGGDELGKPEGIFMLGNCPHDWLFKRVSAVVHHGGAGTTAAGIAAGRPTVIVPFFGDQPFWGAMVARAGAGPDPIPYKNLTAEKLAAAINKALEPESLDKAQLLSDKIKEEDGCQKGAQSFHQMLNYEELRCAVMPEKLAVWRIKRTQTRLSATAATVLAQHGEVNFSDLKLFRPREYVPDEGPWDPISGATGALMGTATSMVMGVADMPIQTLKLLQIHPDSRSRKGKERADSDLTPSDASSRHGRPQTRGINAPTPGSTTTATDTSTTGNLQPPSPLTHSASAKSVAVCPDAPGTPDHRSTFMAQAFEDNTRHTRSPSRDRSGRLSPSHVPNRLGRNRSSSWSSHNHPQSLNGAATDSHNMADNVESALDTGKGLARIIGAGFKSPMDFSLNVAKGFHNVPKLYGGEVRQVDKVTDLQSGLRTAAKEFGFGLYDGLTGIVTDPYKGAKKEGSIGFIKGVGRGLMGVPMRVMAGAWSVPGYAMKGLYQEMVKSKGKNVQNYIIAARIAQGYDETSNMSQHEKDNIVSRWQYIKIGIKKKRTPGAEQMESLHSLIEERKKKKNNRWEMRNAHFKKGQAQQGHRDDTSRSSSYSDLPLTPLGSHEAENTESEIRSTIPSWRKQESDRVAALRRQHNDPYQTPPHQHRSSTDILQSQVSLEAQLAAEEEAEQLELERAITASVAENSRGNPEEDKLIASAIRASIAELERVPVGCSEKEEEETLKRVMQTSMEEAGRTGYSDEEQKIIEETLRKSLLETSRKRQHGSDSEWDTDDTEDDEEFQRILEESKELHRIHFSQSQDEKKSAEQQRQESDFINAMSDAIGNNNASESQVKGANESVREVEEDEEEQLKKAIEQSKIPDPPDTHIDEDEDLKKAIAESQAHEHNVNNHDHDEELKKAIEESERAEKERVETLERQKTEEDIVLEYVRKQSLLEEEHRQRMLQGRDTVGEGSGVGGGMGSG